MKCSQCEIKKIKEELERVEKCEDCQKPIVNDKYVPHFHPQPVIDNNTYQVVRLPHVDVALKNFICSCPKSSPR